MPLTGYGGNSSPEQPGPAPIVVDMEEMSVFDPTIKGLSNLRVGETARTWDEKPSGVSGWPSLESDKPIYGELSLSTGGDVDQKFRFVIDESKGTGTGYDRLHFDLNGDGDLRNDGLLRPLKPPLGTTSSYEQEVWFDVFKMAIGADAEKRKVEIMPRLVIYAAGDRRVRFIATQCRRGTIEVNGSEYQAYLGSRRIAACFDKPETLLYIAPANDPGMAARWWGGYSVNATHKLGGRLYRVAPSPRGDKLTVIPYSGDMGVFRVGAGKRDIKGEITMRGSLASEQTSVAVGGELDRGWPEWASECLVPVGDYLPDYIRIRYGGLEIFISDNYHSEGEGRNRGGRSKVYGIEIRKDRPYVLDFSNEPQVMFTTVTQGMKIKAGEELEVKAVLIDPKLDIMVRGLTEMPQGSSKSSGKSLEPQVVITRADGKIVDKGVMPFG